MKVSENKSIVDVPIHQSEKDIEIAEALNTAIKPVSNKEITLQKFKEEAKQNEAKWFNSLPTDFVLIEQFKNISHFINILNKKLLSGLIIYGRGGIGKTRLVLSLLKKSGVDFVYNNSYTTPLAFAQFLYQHRKDKVIVLDDVEGILKNKVIMSILKSALDTKETRLIHYNSTSKVAKETLPNPFVFDSRIIILLNSIPDNSEIESLFSRLIVKEVNLSYSQIMAVAKDVIKCNHNDLTDDEVVEIVDFIRENSSQATKEFNFRTIEKIVSFYKYSREKWKALALEVLENDDELELIRKLINEYPKNRMKQFIVYQKISGKSRRTFFRKIKQLSSL